MTGSAVDVHVDAVAPEQIDKPTRERSASWENDRILPVAGAMVTVCFETTETEQLDYQMLISDLGSWRRVITPALTTISSPPSPAGLSLSSFQLD